MSNQQFKTLIFFAAGFLGVQIIMWLAFGLYLILTGRA